jgi:hypothetical protein
MLNSPILSVVPVASPEDGVVVHATRKASAAAVPNTRRMRGR